MTYQHPRIGDTVYLRPGIRPAVIVTLRALGTVDVQTPDGARHRVSGLRMVDARGVTWAEHVRAEKARAR